jgi:hypothetical protein
MRAVVVREPSLARTTPVVTMGGPTPAGSVWRERWPSVASLLISATLLPSVLYGLLSDSAYRGYPFAMVVSSRAQDVLTAVILPILVWTSVKSRRGSVPGHVVWLGLLFYVAYSYGIYLIGWPQNRAFLLYVVAVTVAGAALLDGLARIDAGRVAPAVRGLRTRGVGWFLVVIGVAFTGLWLSDVGPSAFGGRAPEHLGVGGTAYAVYVLDLVVALPAVVATGLLMVRRHPIAPVLAGVLLVKITTLFTALWLGVLAQLLAGEEVPFTADMVPSALLLIVTATVLARWWHRLEQPIGGWLHPTLWNGSTAESRPQRDLV